MLSSASARLRRTLSALACAGVAAGCAPDRVPGSTVAQGDSGLSFHQEFASLRGAGTPRHGPGGASGASYGGGSSSSTGVRVAPSDLLELLPRDAVCDWVVGTATLGRADSASPEVERAKGAPAEERSLAGCAAPAETR
jgi:hypothetical protein